MEIDVRYRCPPMHSLAQRLGVPYHAQIACACGTIHGKALARWPIDPVVVAGLLPDACTVCRAPLDKSWRLGPGPIFGLNFLDDPVRYEMTEEDGEGWALLLRECEEAAKRVAGR